MDKEKTMEKISELPEFELRDVAVDKDGWVEQPKDRAVVKIGTSDSIAYVSTQYKLVQFAEVLQPIAEGIDQFDAEVKHFGGVCLMHVYPEMESFSDGKTKYGITALNSVDKSTSIVIKFNVKVDGQPLIFPKKLAGFVKTHTGKSFSLTQNYIEVITKVKEAWGNIIKHFPEIKVENDDIKQISENFKLNKENMENLKTAALAGNEFCLWDVVEMRLKQISNRNYKSDVHKSRALERLGGEIFNYAVVAGI